VIDSTKMATSFDPSPLASRVSAEADVRDGRQLTISWEQAEVLVLNDVEKRS
jgi:hypothetical protein